MITLINYITYLFVGESALFLSTLVVYLLVRMNVVQDYILDIIIQTNIVISIILFFAPLVYVLIIKLIIVLL